MRLIILILVLLLLAANSVMAQDSALFFCGNLPGQRGGTRAARWRRGRRTPSRLTLELETGEHPAHGAIAQCADIGQTQTSQSGGANDAAGAPGAVDDYLGVFSPLQLVGPENQVATGDVDAARNAKSAELLGGAHVENDQVGRTLLQTLELLRSDLGDFSFMLHLFAEGFARHIDAADNRAAIAPPRVQAAVENRDLLVAERHNRRRRQRRPGSGFIVDDYRNIPVGHQYADTKFNLTARQRCHVRDLTLVELPAFAHVENGVKLARCHEVSEIFT